jgi:predicted HNH restriction endonuclease
VGSVTVNGNTFQDILLTARSITEINESTDTGGIIAWYKDQCNNTYGGIISTVYNVLNSTAFLPIHMLNDSITTVNGYIVDQSGNTSAYAETYEFLGLIINFLPTEVKALMLYYFLWMLILILLGK